MNCAASLLYVVGTVACATWNVAPTVDSSIAIPASAGTLRIAWHTAARGTQNYACSASTTSAAASYAWTLTGPDAVLANCRGTRVGHHQASAGAGSPPQWTHTDGSSVIGSRVASFNANATSIPWLLLHAASTSGRGVLTDVRYIQRVNTVGGRAPDTGCDAAHVGTIRAVHYSADYYFYAP